MNLFSLERARARPDHLAAETKPAIDCANRDELEKHTIAIAAHNASDRALQRVADRIGMLGRIADEFADVGNILPRDRVAGSPFSISSATAGVSAMA